MMFIQCAVCVVGIFCLRQVDRPVRWLIVSLLCWTLISIISFVVRLKNMHNLWIGHIDTIIDTSLFSIVFYMWRTSKLNGQFIKGTFIVFFIAWAIDGIFFDAFHKGFNIATAIQGLLEAIFSVNLLANVLLDERSHFWKHDPRFWVASGYLLYAGGTFFLFSFFRSIAHIPIETFRILWYINRGFTVVAFAFFTRALLCRPEKAI